MVSNFWLLTVAESAKPAGATRREGNAPWRWESIVPHLSWIRRTKHLRHRQERLREIDEKADELLGKAATIVEQEVQRATQRENFYARWRDTVAALKREDIVDQACALLRDRMDLRGNDSLDWLLLQVLDPQGYSKRSSDQEEMMWAKAVRLDALARLTDQRIGRKRLARETGASEAMIQAWRKRPDYQRAVDRAVEFLRPREELRRRREEPRVLGPSRGPRTNRLPKR